MSRLTPSEKEIQALLQAPANKRAEYCIKHIVDEEQVWSLANHDGWVLTATDEGREVVPIWPHPKYAKVAAIDEWSDCAPQAISLSDWLEKWIPGQERDGRAVVLFPNPQDNGPVL